MIVASYVSPPLLAGGPLATLEVGQALAGQEVVAGLEPLGSGADAGVP